METAIEWRRKKTPQRRLRGNKELRKKMNQGPFHIGQQCGQPPGRHTDRQNASNALHLTETSEEWNLHTVAGATQHRAPVRTQPAAMLTDGGCLDQPKASLNGPWTIL